MQQRYGFKARLTTFVLIVVVLCTAFLVRQIRLPAIEPDVDILQPGDLIYVDLYRSWNTVTYWDHMAIYVGDQDVNGGRSGPAVVEATFNGGIIRTPLAAFLSRDAPVQMTVQRLTDVPSRAEVIQTAVDFALAQVGKAFDFTASATIPLKINGDNLHCAEVVWRAYKAAGIELDSDGGILLYPDDIYYSPMMGLVEAS